MTSDLVDWLTPNIGNPVPMDPDQLYEKREVAAEWQVPLKGQIYKVEFEHGTASGKRVLWINQKEVLRREWMFKLVGEDSFKLDGIRCIIRVDPAPGFRYIYNLYVDGKPFTQFTERQARILKAWETTIGNRDYRIVLEKDTLNIWLNGQIRQETGEFVDDGADTEFIEDDIRFVLKTRSSGNKRSGIVHLLFANDESVPEVEH